MYRVHLFLNHMEVCVPHVCSIALFVSCRDLFLVFDAEVPCTFAACGRFLLVWGAWNRAHLSEFEHWWEWIFVSGPLAVRDFAC